MGEEEPGLSPAKGSPGADLEQKRRRQLNYSDQHHGVLRPIITECSQHLGF